MKTSHLSFLWILAFYIIVTSRYIATIFVSHAYSLRCVHLPAHSERPLLLPSFQNTQVRYCDGFYTYMWALCFCWKAPKPRYVVFSISPPGVISFICGGESQGLCRWVRFPMRQPRPQDSRVSVYCSEDSRELRIRD